MQVSGLPRQIIMSGRAASRLLAAKTPSIEAERRRDAVARWRRAIANGLIADEAAQAVGASRSTLYRWEKVPEPGSRRPKRVRQAKWPPALIEAVEAIRSDNPMWGKRKITGAPPTRRPNRERLQDRAHSEAAHGASRSTADRSSCPSLKTIAATSGRTRRTPGQAARSQRMSRASPVELEILELRLLGSPSPYRQTPAPRRRLRLPIQPPQTSPRPWRSHPSRVSHHPRPADPAV